MSQWAAFAKLRVPFHLYVPVGCIDSARRLCADLQIPAAEVWAYSAIGDQMRFTLVQKTAPAVDGKRTAAAPAPAAAAPKAAAAKPAAAATKPAPRARAAAPSRRAAAPVSGRRKAVAGKAKTAPARAAKGARKAAPARSARTTKRR
jgi:hypothetical protein